jgi:AmmeMemoRadiSam system protein A
MKTILLAIARDAIKSRFEPCEIDTAALLHAYPELNKRAACFVTLTQNGCLRGCIGSLVAHCSLLEGIISNARSAAFKDPRFAPLQEDELEKTKIEFSLLSPPQLLEYRDTQDLKEKIRSGRDGVVLRAEEHQATFLPQVWEELQEFELFFSHLCQKAGLKADCLEAHPEIYTYQVEKAEES